MEISDENGCSSISIFLVAKATHEIAVCMLVTTSYKKRVTRHSNFVPFLCEMENTKNYIFNHFT